MGGNGFDADLNCHPTMLNGRKIVQDLKVLESGKNTYREIIFSSKDSGLVNARFLDPVDMIPQESSSREIEGSLPTLERIYKKEVSRNQIELSVKNLDKMLKIAKDLKSESILLKYPMEDGKIDPSNAVLFELQEPEDVRKAHGAIMPMQRD